MLAAQLDDTGNSGTLSKGLKICIEALNLRVLIYRLLYTSTLEFGIKIARYR